MLTSKEGRGDYAGIAGKLNDGAMVTTDVYNNFPNDYGLYNMAGNVNEWVWDVYRPMSFQDFEDLNPVRRDGFLDEERGYDSQNFNSLISDNARVYKGGFLGRCSLLAISWHPQIFGRRFRHRYYRLSLCTYSCRN